MSDHDTKIIDRLEAENDALRARVANLEKLLAMQGVDLIRTEIAVQLTGSERTVLGVLMQRERISSCRKPSVCSKVT